MSGAPLHRFTVEAYERLVALGALTPEDRVELLDGFLVDKTSENLPHATAVRRLYKHFAVREGGSWVTQSQSGLQLDQSLPEPDVALLRPPEEAYTTRRPTSADAFLLVEVAESSLAVDQGAKLRAYARAGISEYWIVNLAARVVEVHRRPDPRTAGYGVVFLARPGDQLAPERFPDAALAVGGLFPPAV